MSLATRCTSCSTVFRVVQDQLKISEGWVRCGRCDAVFNALEGLFDLDRETPAEWEARAEPGPMPEPSVAAAVPENELPQDPQDRQDRLHTEAGSAAALDEPFVDPVDAHLFGPRKKTDSAPKPAGQVGARDRLEFSDARFDSDLSDENAPLVDTEAPESAATEAAALPLETTTRPEFLRRAERRALWRSGPARAVLLLGCALTLLTLLVQIGHHHRDSLAARWPLLRPALASWCAGAGCALEPLRRLQDVLVESTALTHTSGLDSFVLSVNLRNRGPLALALPWVDLNLTDGNGRLVARRALAPRDFRAPDVLQAGAEAALQLTLATGAAAVAGYTVEIFYP